MSFRHTSWKQLLGCKSAPQKLWSAERFPGLRAMLKTSHVLLIISCPAHYNPIVLSILQMRNLRLREVMDLPKSTQREYGQSGIQTQVHLTLKLMLCPCSGLPSAARPWTKCWTSLSLSFLLCRVRITVSPPSQSR